MKTWKKIFLNKIIDFTIYLYGGGKRPLELGRKSNDVVQKCVGKNLEKTF